MSEKSGRPRSGRRGLTIADLARAAGVSISTASNAINATGRMAADTREKVLRVAGEIGYRPNELAQSLHRSRSMTVGIISNDSFGRFIFPVVEALEEQFADKGIAIYMCNATDDPERERQHLDQLLGKRVDGIVVTSRRSDKREPIGPIPAELPLVYINSEPNDGNAVVLLPDDAGGARLAVDHLVELGRKRIAHITGPERFEAVRLRRGSYFESLRRAGLPIIDGFFLSGAWSEVWGREAIAQLFDGHLAPPDALFCGNDQIARGASDTLDRRGVPVPDDVAIVGFDNWSTMTDAATPPLTSVDMNLKRLGSEAGRLLIEMMGGGKVAPGIRRLPTSLVVRGSSHH